jgi:anthranilate synthase/aminodeoxychorismate synthase-like glutamine amidotransferase
MSVLMIDNRDSFTFNLVEAFERLGETVTVLRNSVSADAALARAEAERALIVLSPGPGRPEDAGCSIALIAKAKGRAPLLGVCLGHQAIVHEAGGAVAGAPAIVHGKASVIDHDGTGPFEGLPNPLRVGRYHSLCTPNPPERFRVHGEIDGMAMAISDAEARQYGIQFHPESILTPHGDDLLRNIVRLAVHP